MTVEPSTRLGSVLDRTAWAAWCRFWFTPADPTPLCLMRIVTGLLVLYVHVAYTFDLQALFGADGWYPTAMADRERREWPVFVPQSIWGQRDRRRFACRRTATSATPCGCSCDNLAGRPGQAGPGFPPAPRRAGDRPRRLAASPSEFLRTLPPRPGRREDKLRDMVNAPPPTIPTSRSGAEFEALYGHICSASSRAPRASFRIDAHALADDAADRRRRAARTCSTCSMQEGPAAIESSSRSSAT